MGRIPAFDPFHVAATSASELDRVARDEAMQLRKAHRTLRLDPLDLPDAPSLLSLRHTTSPDELQLFRSLEQISAEIDRLEVPQASSVQDRLDGSRRILRSIAALETSGVSEQDAGDLVARGHGIAVSALCRLRERPRAQRLWRLGWTAIVNSSIHWDVRAALLRQRAQLLLLDGRAERARKLLADLSNVHWGHGEARLFARATIALVNLEALLGHAEEGLKLLRKARRVLDPNADQIEFWGVIFNLGWICESLERPHAVAKILRDLQRLENTVAPPPPSIRARLLWLYGRVELRKERFRASEEYLIQAKELFLAQGELETFCLVSLELALAVFNQGRNAEVKEIVSPTITLLLAIDYPRESVAAVYLLHKAAWAGTLNTDLFRGAIRALATCNIRFLRA